MLNIVLLAESSFIAIVLNYEGKIIVIILLGCPFVTFAMTFFFLAL